MAQLKYWDQATGTYKMISGAGPIGPVGPAGTSVVQHGADASVARPSSAVVCFWFGSVEPTNMAVTDIWVVT